MRRFGRKPHSMRKMLKAPIHVFGTIKPPAKLDRHGFDYQPGLYQNDTLPDCSAVALVNGARGVAALNAYDLVVDPSDVPTFYGNCIGNPPDLANSDGAELLDVLAYQAANGFLIGPQSLVGVAGVVILNRMQLAASMDRLGVAYWGIRLLERDMDTTGVWDVQQGRDDGDVVGLHAVNAWDYTGLGDTDTVRIGTWGYWQSVTWAWIAARLDEAHGIVWRQLERTDGTFYAGLTADGLINDLA